MDHPRERLVNETRRLRLSIAEVELPDGMQFEQYVLRIPKAVMTVVLDDAAERVLMIWRHRFVPERWTWELPGGLPVTELVTGDALTVLCTVVSDWRPI